VAPIHFLPHPHLLPLPRRLLTYLHAIPCLAGYPFPLSVLVIFPLIVYFPGCTISACWISDLWNLVRETTRNINQIRQEITGQNCGFLESGPNGMRRMEYMGIHHVIYANISVCSKWWAYTLSISEDSCMLSGMLSLSMSSSSVLNTCSHWSSSVLVWYSWSTAVSSSSCPDTQTSASGPYLHHLMRYWCPWPHVHSSMILSTSHSCWPFGVMIGAGCWSLRDGNSSALFGMCHLSSDMWNMG